MQSNRFESLACCFVEFMCQDIYLVLSWGGAVLFSKRDCINQIIFSFSVDNNCTHIWVCIHINGGVGRGGYVLVVCVCDVYVGYWMCNC